MDKNLLKKLKESLEKERLQIEERLKKIAKKDEKQKGDWNIVFPKWDGETGGSSMETAADQVEEYINLLPQEHVLELKLQNVNLALKKIGEGKYGSCEKCGKEIPIERLKVSPEARFCLDCKKQQ